MTELKDFNFGAVILDMDGVITKTESVHARAWKKMFDEFLAVKQGKEFQPLTIEHDYRKFIDGIPRLDGVRGFLKSRNIEIPEGSPEDAPEKNTVHGLGKRKNTIFKNIIAREGIAVYDDAVVMIDKWKGDHIKLAVISSSKNCKAILEQTNLADRFEVRIDGNTLKKENLPGKPEPDIFLKAAESLGVNLEDTMIIEDAIQGVEAAKKGKFGFVVGVSRNGNDTYLQQAGADLVVKNLTELSKIASQPRASLPNALEEIEELSKKRGNRKIAIFLDYDGTLTPIVSDPDAAELSAQNRALIADLSELIPVTIISGRDLKDLKSKIKIDSVIYAGSHGFDISGPDGLEMKHDSETEITPALDRAEIHLHEHLDHIQGSKVERKKFAIAVHYRNVPQKDVQLVKDLVQREADLNPNLKTGSGKKVLELKPDLPWNKGYALDWLTDTLGWDREKYLRIYIGDDITDEDGFKAVGDDGIGILVGFHGEKTAATLALQNIQEVTRFLTHLKDQIQ